ncbi:homocysteine S-methyltransferase [Leuconostoc gelidum]|uniref:homocysteine S-methyltransferase n=1 Tax=Leuconostoc gelidum TaxID=1244 RepID=UPI000219279F|nr:homocysteine S-methyltransferase [Leuconostoc gelidum]AFS40688.1 homocysteine methyltransferase [Leuconostoc gelidum JB7]MBZ5991799.1 homocysteine S-methyltransferase [Leuconostoc gelidum subsp. gelidum]MBZ6013364.1 homocysteine S-methyltransferase [Leuconostoc gelidum subsp. gelidum]USP17893.1 homocysteine S-methyltransferase [Leuconostoc gelidum subsp. aenigmaticum]GMA67937.1 homocysteine S-methyltransferase [Leuconostoc gelidum subsp. gelidum]
MTKFESYIESGVVVIDGGMGSELEKRQIDVNNSWWSASALIQSPEDICDIHKNYFNAGASLAITDTYQAHIKSFTDQGLSETKAYELIDSAVNLARHGLENSNRSDGLIAGSVGPYGAYLANGAEYTGNYYLSESEFQAFHRPRIARLIADGVDVFALETMPNFEETKALGHLLQQEFPSVDAYLSFATENGDHLWDGTPLSEAVTYFESISQIKAIGVNCTSPQNILPALKNITPNTSKKIIVYPNAGDDYDPETKRWVSQHGPIKWDELVPIWLAAGASLIGGCCRTSPDDINEIALAIINTKQSFV